MRRHGVRFFIISINFVLIVMITTYAFRQSDNISILQIQKEQMEKEYEKLQSDCIELKRQMEEYKIANEELTKKLDEQKRITPEGYQPFYGLWAARGYYKADVEGEQECWKKIEIKHYYIRLDGPNHVTDEPIYDIAVRISSDVVDELKLIGVEDENLIDMLQAECYAELDISNTYNWHRELFPREVDFVENAKYYIIDNQTMLCVSKNNGGRVYVLGRLGY